MAKLFTFILFASLLSLVVYSFIRVVNMYFDRKKAEIEKEIRKINKDGVE